MVQGCGYVSVSNTIFSKQEKPHDNGSAGKRDGEGSTTPKLVKFHLPSYSMLDFAPIVRLYFHTSAALNVHIKFTTKLRLGHIDLASTI
jgi:hypothetical protein